MLNIGFRQTQPWRFVNRHASWVSGPSFPSTPQNGGTWWMFSRARIGKHQWGCLHARRDCWWFDDHIPFDLPSSKVAGWEMPELNEGWEHHRTQCGIFQLATVWWPEARFQGITCLQSKGNSFLRTSKSGIGLIYGIYKNWVNLDPKQNYSKKDGNTSQVMSPIVHGNNGNVLMVFVVALDP